MNVVFIEAAAPLDPDLAAEVAKQSAHASREIQAFQWDPERRIARVEIAPGAARAEVEDKVGRLLSAMSKRHRALPKKTLGGNLRSDAGPMLTGVESAMIERGWLREPGPGQVVLAGPALSFARAFDARIAAIAKARFHAREEAYPSLIPSGVLHRCGYVTSFPQSLSMVTHLAEDLDAIERFRQANAASTRLAIPEPSALAHPSVCLAPAVCYHFYPSLSRLRIATDVIVATAAARCFRYESRNMRGLSRLWDFTMREIMFVGGAEPVAATRRALIEIAIQLGTELDLDFTVESASDPFFGADHAQKSYWQARNDLKFEMKLAVPSQDGEARTVAAASFNLHDDHFGQVFEILDQDERPASSGCAAWGVERWVLAAFAQHGLGPARWPASFRDAVFG